MSWVIGSPEATGSRELSRNYHLGPHWPPLREKSSCHDLISHVSPLLHHVGCLASVPDIRHTNAHQKTGRDESRQQAANTPQTLRLKQLVRSVSAWEEITLFSSALIRLAERPVMAIPLVDWLPRQKKKLRDKEYGTHNTDTHWRPRHWMTTDSQPGDSGPWKSQSLILIILRY